MTCQMEAIMSNVHHYITFFPFIPSFPFYSSSYFIIEYRRDQRGMKELAVNDHEKCVLSRRIHQRGGMCNHTTAMKAAAAHPGALTN